MGVGGLDPLKICRRVRVCFDPSPQKCPFFHSQLLLNYSTSFTSSRMEDLCRIWKVKLIFRGTWNSLMAWPNPRILRRVCITDTLGKEQWLSMVQEVTVGPAECNGSLLPCSWLTSPAGLVPVIMSWYDMIILTCTAQKQKKQPKTTKMKNRWASKNILSN